jgi:hypothetical protein
MTNTIKVGDVIKSLDFPGNESCYMIGKVVAIAEIGDLYNCKAIIRVWEDKARVVTSADDFTTQAQGLHWMDKQYPGRVTLIA